MDVTVTVVFVIQIVMTRCNLCSIATLVLAATHQVNASTPLSKHWIRRWLTQV